MKTTLRLSIRLALLICALPAAAHEVPVHEILTREAAARSALATDSKLLAGMGFPAWDAQAYLKPSPSLSVFVALSEVMAYGAMWEDEAYSWRAFNHFFDPQANNGLGRGLNFEPVKANPSPTWILEDLGNQTDYYDGTCPEKYLRGCPQEFSFKKGQQELYKALTAASPAERDTARFKVFQNVGHVIHHIQDMSQPQHTRNDQHTHPLPFTDFNPRWAFYEVYTLENKAKIVDILRGNPYPTIPKFATARAYWYTEGGAAPKYSGMAEFTSNNYTSYGPASQFVGRRGDPNYVGAGPEFPYPNGSNRHIERYNQPPVRYADGKFRGGETDYVVGVVTDSVAPAAGGKRIFAAKSLLSELDPNGTPIYIENALIYEANYSTLLPRAVAFSAGMINHFFRGRIELYKGSSANVWTVKNTGADSISGTVSIFAEDGAGTRTSVSGASTTVGTLSSGASVSLNVAPPAGTQKLVAVFRGRIGAEGDASNPDWSAVAGAVASYGAPEIVIVGTSWNSNYPLFTRAFRWSTKNGLSHFYLAAKAVGNEALGVSADGKYIVGSTTGSKTTFGNSMNDYGYYINSEVPPTTMITAALTVATGWSYSDGKWGGGTHFINGAEANYSRAWRVTDTGMRAIYGEAQNSVGAVYPAVWNWQGLNATPTPTPRNPMKSADGSVVLGQSNNLATYTTGGKTVTLPVMSGHNVSQATHVVIVP